MAKLNESNKIISQEVSNAYRACEGGKLKVWASKKILNTLAFYRNEREFVPTIQCIIESVICTMVSDGKLKVINVKDANEPNHDLEYHDKKLEGR